MKLISFTVPCYNSQDYMRNCIDTLLTGGEDAEIIIVNDGSKDDTINIAREYESKYPSIVRVVDKENGGHGSGVNAGVREATGLYFKVVDSDDKLDTDALAKLLDIVRGHVAAGTLPDLYITNFIYDHASDGTRHVSSYEKKMPEGRIIGWEDVKPFKYSHMLLMHSLMYKLDVLRASDTVLPEKTFYVDNLFAYKPLPFVKTIYYANLDLYKYFIGRDDQSVNKKNFIKRYDQQTRVMLCMVDAYSLDEIKKMSKGLRKYMWHALEVIMMNTMYFIGAVCDKDRKKTYKEMWAHIKARDKAMYKKLRHRSYPTVVVYLPWRLRGAIMGWGYDFLCKKIKLG